MSYKSPKLKVTNGVFHGFGALSGEIQEVGVGGRYLARAYDQKTGIFCGAQYSGADGSITFANYDASRQYFVVAFDDDSGTPRNASVVDRQIPA